MRLSRQTRRTLVLLGVVLMAFSVFFYVTALALTQLSIPASVTYTGPKIAAFITSTAITGCPLSGYSVPATNSTLQAPFGGVAPGASSTLFLCLSNSGNTPDASPRVTAVSQPVNSTFTTNPVSGSIPAVGPGSVSVVISMTLSVAATATPGGPFAFSLSIS